MNVKDICDCAGVSNACARVVVMVAVVEGDDVPNQGAVR